MTKRDRNPFPSMHFYPDRWLSGRATRMMTPEQKGGFMDLLAHAWDGDEPCTLPDDPTLLAQLSGLGAKRWQAAGALIRAQFATVPDLPGRIRNSQQFEIYCRQIIKREKKRGRNGNRWRSLRARIFARDGYRCVYCGAKGVPLQCDHIIPQSRGGSNDPANLATACRMCNRSKADRTPEEWRRGDAVTANRRRPNV